MWLFIHVLIVILVWLISVSKMENGKYIGIKKWGNDFQIDRKGNENHHPANFQTLVQLFYGISNSWKLFIYGMEAYMFQPNEHDISNWYIIG